MAMVHQSIEDRRCHHLIAKHLVPLFLHQAVGAVQHTALLVAAGDQLEEQVPRLGFERQVAQFIDDRQFRLRESSAEGAEFVGTPGWAGL